MRSGGGKAKGSSFERKMCKALSLWVTHGALPDCFWRSAMSGGRATVQRRKGVQIRQSGDITAVAPEGQPFAAKWFVECKHVRKLRLSSFLLTNTGPLAKFWKVASREAKAHGKQPMIIARENGQPTIVLVPRNQLLEGPKLLRADQYDVLLFDELLKTRYVGASAYELGDDTTRAAIPGRRRLGARA